MILILGAGLTGLSTGFHLGDREHLILEKESDVGGLCRSFLVDGFTFDLTGHLLHLRDEKIRQLVDAVQSAGVYQVVWDGRDARGLEVASGVYLYRRDAGSCLQTRRLVLLK